MNKSPLLTVIIPNYNTEKFVELALKSAANEFRELLEIIVVDDGSTDNSLRVINQFIQQDTSGAEIRLISQDNKGPGNARNKALSLARGIYLGFLDSDDLYLPGIASSTVPLMKQKDLDIIEYHFKRINLSGDAMKAHKRFYNYIGKYSLPELLPNIFARTAWYPSIRFFKREIWQGISFPEGVYYEDPMTIYQIYRRSKSIYFLKQVFLAYRLRQGSITTTFTKKKYIDLYNFFSSIAVVDLPMAILKIRIGRTLIRFSNLLVVQKNTLNDIRKSILKLRFIYLNSIFVLSKADMIFFLCPNIYCFLDKQYQDIWILRLRELFSKSLFKLKTYFKLLQ